MEMYMEIEPKLLAKIEELVWYDYEKEGNKVKTTAVYGMLEDLVAMYENLKEEYENYKEFVNDNYKKVSVAEQVE